jgi:hypothetical protein
VRPCSSEKLLIYELETYRMPNTCYVIYGWALGSKKPMGESAKLSILPAGDSSYLYKIPCRAVWDRKVNENHFSSISMRRCGVQFGELTPYQKAQLEQFIQDHTTGETSD